MEDVCIFFSSLVELSSMFCRPFFASDNTFVLRSSPNKSIYSSIQSYIKKDNFPSTNNSMAIPRNLCFFPLDTLRLPKCSDIVSITFVITYLSICDTLLLSIYHDVVHCLSLMMIFTMHLSYALIRNPC